MSSVSTSVLESAIMRSVCAKVFTVFTVRVRSFFRPRISKYPSFSRYRTLASERMGKRREGFFRFRIDSSMPFASFWILGTTFLLILPAPFQGVFQGRADLLLALVVDAEDFLQRNSDVRDVLLDVRALLLRVRLAQPAPDVEPQLPTRIL